MLKDLKQKVDIISTWIDNSCPVQPPQNDSKLRKTH